MGEELLEPGLHAFVSGLMWLLGIELRSSVRAVNT